MTEFKQHVPKIRQQFTPIQNTEETFSRTSPASAEAIKTLVTPSSIAGRVELRQHLGQKHHRTAFSTLASGSLYSALTTDYLIGVTHLSYAPTIGLPIPNRVGIGKIYVVKDEAGGAATTTITVVSQGVENIDGASSSTLTTNYQAKRFYSDGANWFTW